ncbi:MAG: VIT1/CCC1 transporter family protein [Chromatiales bacterium]|nr:VIT1/CCC1 transporter family protein [Chromatiales bacterium]
MLQPAERIAEILFGLIMVLTFTGSLSVADAGRDDVRAMLIGALGCNLAWGIIDGIFYLMGCLAERGQNLATYRAVRSAAGADEASRLLAESLPPVVSGVLEPAELSAIRDRLSRLPAPPGRPHLVARDWRGALGVLLLVFLSTFPVAVPFILMQQLQPAMRVSNAIAVLLLFALGHAYGRVTGYRPWLVGLLMVVIGSILVALTIALGG